MPASNALTPKIMAMTSVRVSFLKISSATGTKIAVASKMPAQIRLDNTVIVMPRKAFCSRRTSSEGSFLKPRRIRKKARKSQKTGQTTLIKDNHDSQETNWAAYMIIFKMAVVLYIK